MKSKKLISNLLVAAALSTAATGTALAADPGETGPLLMSYRLQDMAGEPVSLEDFRGEVLVVNFWASWCAPCLRELPVLDHWNTAWQNEEARVVAISIDRKAKNALGFIAMMDLGLTVWLDGPQGLAAELDLPAVPTSYVIDRDGRVVLRIEGSSPADLAKMHRVAQSLLAANESGPEA